MKIGSPRRDTDHGPDAFTSPKSPQRVSKKHAEPPPLIIRQAASRQVLSTIRVLIRFPVKVGREFAVDVQSGQARLVGVIQNLGRHHKSEAARKGQMMTGVSRTFNSANYSGYLEASNTLFRNPTPLSNTAHSHGLKTWQLSTFSRKMGKFQNLLKW